jgi:uncharacterized protein
MTFAQYVVFGSLILGMIFGYTAHRTNFCTMGAVSDIVNIGDHHRMRMWALAIAVAMIGTQALVATGTIDLAKSFYWRPQLTWLSHILGGTLFGFGMVLASGCGSKTLVRIGGGNLKSVVVFIVMGIFAYMTLRGIVAVARVASIDRVNLSLDPGQGLGPLLATTAGTSAATAGLIVGTLLAVGILVYVFADSGFRKSAEGIVGGVVIGGVIVAGWYVSGRLGFGENLETLETMYFATNSRTIESFSFVAPAAYSLELLMLWSDTSLKITFGVAATMGVIVGSFISALHTGAFRWEGFASSEDTANHLVGAAIMGIGGVTALGCTVGQGLSGLSTLAIGSFITFIFIVLGAVLGLKYQIWRLEQMDA